LQRPSIRAGGFVEPATNIPHTIVYLNATCVTLGQRGRHSLSLRSGVEQHPRVDH
jgi:hypothetical protein